MSLPGPRTRFEWRAFTVAGIPVTFSAWFLLSVWMVLGRSGGMGIGLVHLLAVTVSVVVHELGHGLAARRYGLRPAILIHGFGGYCEHLPARRRNDDLVVVASGPGAGFALGVLAGVLWWVLPGLPLWAEFLLYDLAWMGLFWTLVNVLPVLPLDGGSILKNLLERRKSLSKPGRSARVVSVVVAILAALVGIWLREPTMVILLAILAYGNAAVLAWVPEIPGLSLGPVQATGGPRSWIRADWWKPTTATAVLLGTVALAALLSPWTSGLALDPTAGPWGLWRIGTYALGPSTPAAVLSSLLVLWLVGPPVERRLGAVAFGLFALAAALLAGVSAAIAGALLPSAPIAGPVPVALAVAAAWAWLARDWSLGPNAVLSVRPPLALAVVLVIDLVDCWSDRNAGGAAADVVAVAIGLAAARLPADPWNRLVLWWRLRNPPPVQIRNSRPR